MFSHLFVTCFLGWCIRGFLEQHADESFGLGTQDTTLAQDDAVGAHREKFRRWNYLELLLSCDADADDNGNSHAELDILLDDVPAAHFHRNLVTQAMLLERAVHHGPGAEVARRKNERITADVLQ